MRHVLDVDEHHRVLRELRVCGHEAAWTVDARRVMSGAGDEHERALRPVRRLCEMARERNEYRQPVAVVAGAVEPAVDVRVEVLAVVSLARDCLTQYLELHGVDSTASKKTLDARRSTVGARTA